MNILKIKNKNYYIRKRYKLKMIEILQNTMERRYLGFLKVGPLKLPRFHLP
jgi:hypothetical protein